MAWPHQKLALNRRTPGTTSCEPGGIHPARHMRLAAGNRQQAIAFGASFPRLWRGGLGQGLPPAIALLTAAQL